MVTTTERLVRVVVMECVGGTSDGLQHDVPTTQPCVRATWLSVDDCVLAERTGDLPPEAIAEYIGLPAEDGGATAVTTVDSLRLGERAMVRRYLRPGSPWFYAARVH